MTSVLAGVDPVWVNLATYSGADTNWFIQIDYKHAILYSTSNTMLNRWSNLLVTFRYRRP